MFNLPFAKQRIWFGVKFTLMRCDLSDKGIWRGLPDRLSGINVWSGRAASKNSSNKENIRIYTRFTKMHLVSLGLRNICGGVTEDRAK